MKFAPLILLLVLLISCERTIDFDLDETTPKLVVEATIENGGPPVVFLSRSLSFFSEISPDILAASFVHDAEVYVSNGQLTHRLKEYEQVLAGNYKIYYYSTDSSDLSTAFNGALNTSYSLRIVAEGKKYTASTKIPLITKRLDSIWWEPGPPQMPADKVKVMVRAYDRPGYGDYIRYFTKRNSEPFFPGWNSVFDDQVIDGTTYDIQVERGIPRNLGFEEEDLFFSRGDTATLKLCNIDKATYDFWRTLEFSYASNGNPFSSPIKVLSNISNGALGYFGGYGCQYKTIVIPQ